jgi:Domain of unknown function (DUF5666)
MKTLAIHPFGLALLAAVAVGVAGCGNGAGSSVAPTAATLSSSSFVQDSHGGGNSGPGNNGGSGNNNAPGNNSGPGKGDDGHNGIEVHGSIQSISGACPAKQLTIAGRKVSTSMSTEFRDTTCANLAVGQTAEVKGTLQSDGTIAADRVEVAGRDDGHDEGEVSGPVTASTGTCPALTLTVGTSIVKTTAASIFHDVACSAVQVGIRIEANGTRQSDGSLLASSLEREDDE